MKKNSLAAILFSIFFTSNIFAQPAWIQQTSPVTSDLNSCCAVNTNVCWMCGPNGVVIRTTNGGSTWFRRDAGLTGNDLYTIYALNENNCWAGTGGNVLWHTINGGSNWTSITFTPVTPWIDVVHFFNANTGFVIADPSQNQWRYYITTNGGANWSLGANAPFATGTEAGWNNSYCALDTGHIWWGTNVTKIWRGSFRGPFSSFGIGNPQYPNSYGVSFSDLFHGIVLTSSAQGGAGPVLVTTNGGINWFTSFTPASTAYGLKSVPGTSYAWLSCGSGSSGVIYRSTNYGITFSSQISLSNIGYCISMANINCGWAGTATGKIYKYTDNVGIGEPVTAPAKFELKQNYPNPFNSTTSIDFSLAQTGYITLKIYNLLGQEVITLIDGVETAGNHTTILDASNLPSGVYFYTMKSGDPVSGTGQVFTDTKNLILIK